MGGRFEPWVEDCPLHYHSNNAPKKVNVLGSLFLSILSGHRRYAHITSLMSDRVNSKLLGMSKVVSNDLVALLNRLPIDSKPEFVRGDIGWGTDNVMTEMEGINQHYLFKLKRSNNVKKLIYRHHCLGEWSYINKEWEAKEDVLQLQGWEKERRVVVVRRRLSSDHIIGIECEKEGQQQLAFIDGPEDIRAYEYSVLVTNLKDDLVTLFYHYRDRADCENNFDEIKNQWGWGGYTTKNIKSCQFMARMIALVYNWWNLFVRLAIPQKHHEAITSRPLLLSSIGRLTEHGRQKKMVITSTHGDIEKLKNAYRRVIHFFNELKAAAQQLTSTQCWCLILAKAMEKFRVGIGAKNQFEQPLPS
jgi:hypothetical protein